MTVVAHARHLRALGIEPLRLRARVAVPDALPSPVVAASPEPAAGARTLRKLALQPDNAELADPAIQAMYTALTEAVGKAGLQRVRVCDVADDAEAMVMVFGAAPAPAGVPALRVVRVDPLSVLNTDRERKRLLWEQMQKLARGSGD